MENATSSINQQHNLFLRHINLHVHEFKSLLSTLPNLITCLFSNVIKGEGLSRIYTKKVSYKQLENGIRKFRVPTYLRHFVVTLL